MNDFDYSVELTAYESGELISEEDNTFGNLVWDGKKFTLVD